MWECVWVVWRKKGIVFSECFEYDCISRVVFKINKKYILVFGCVIWL